MSRVLIPGNAGKIEAMVDVVEGATCGCVVCHPHPLYGGTMDDAVVALIAAGFHAAGVSTLRFNFRGVGESEGDHDRGNGETGDAITVCDWFKRERGYRKMYLAGYSFGAAVALRAAAMADCAAALLVAPPVQRIDDADFPAVPVTVILGADDPIVECNAVQAVFKARDNATVHVIPGEDHFFRSAQDEIVRLAQEFARGA